MGDYRRAPNAMPPHMGAAGGGMMMMNPGSGGMPSTQWGVPNGGTMMNGAGPGSTPAPPQMSGGGMPPGGGSYYPGQSGQMAAPPTKRLDPANTMPNVGQAMDDYRRTPPVMSSHMGASNVASGGGMMTNAGSGGVPSSHGPPAMPHMGYPNAPGGGMMTNAGSGGAPSSHGPPAMPHMGYTNVPGGGMMTNAGSGGAPSTHGPPAMPPMGFPNVPGGGMTNAVSGSAPSSHHGPPAMPPRMGVPNQPGSGMMMNAGPGGIPSTHGPPTMPHPNVPGGGMMMNAGSGGVPSGHGPPAMPHMGGPNVPGGGMMMNAGPGMMPPAPGMPHMGGSNVPGGGMMMNAGPAMPPAPGGMAPGGSYYPGQSGPMAASTAAQQQKRLDPNMMPSAVQVMDDDRKAHTGAFATGYPRSELPPLVTTEFYCEDQGNCFPKFVRSTLYNGPVNNDLLKQCAIPFALAISPVARLHPKERALPIVNLGDLGPVRCTRCKAYMCPFMEFKDGGRRFRCPFCKSTTEVPTEYFAHLDQNGQRTDIYERPELCLGSYEFVATKEYCKNNVFPKPPAFIFMLDVSYNAIRNGIVKLFCDNIKTLLQDLPKDFGVDKSYIDVGFATYDQSVHFYNLKSALGQPKMLIVNDVQDTFVPLVDGFLVNLQEAESVIDTLLSQIPQLFADTKVTEIILGPAIQAGFDALKSSDRPGKLFIFHTSLPIYDAPGKLKNRDDRQLLGTEKEKTVLLPASEFYNKLAQDCVGAGCCVDVYLFPNSYADVATIGCLCGMTGGQLYKYQYFQADLDGDRFLSDLKTDISRPIVFDSIMRVRTSTGVRPTDFYGNFFMSNTTDVEMAALDCDKTVTVEIKHDDKIEDTAVFVQVALLFTSVSGQRRLRIHNLSLNIGSDLASLYRSADLFTVVNYLAKQGERLLLQKTPREVRESMVNRCAQMLATYRQHCSPGSSMGQLVLPETMKLLPLLVNCIIKHSAFTGGSDLSIDDRAWLMQILPSMSPLDTVYYFYPRVLPVHEFVEESEEYSTAVRCSYENLNSAGAYLFENGIVILFWIGLSVSQQWIQDVFGVQTFAQINAEKHDLPEKDNVTSRNLRRLINKVQAEKGRCMKLYIIKQQDKLEPWFRKFMVEDKGSDSSPSYVEFLCHVHKEIRNLLS